MSDRAKKIIVLEIVVLATLLILWGIGHYSNSSVSPDDSMKATLEITFFDVGKGDCILIETLNGAAMIDTGYDENGTEIVGWLKEREIDSLQYLILTHPDKDHIGGADSVIHDINIGQIIDTDCEVDSDDYEQYKQAATKQGVDILTLKETKEILLGDAKLTIYPPIGTDFVGENNYSLVTMLSYGETNFLFAGDSEEDRIDELYEQIPDLQSTLLKVPHHGALMDNSEEFFMAVAPQYSIITSDKEKMYKNVTKILQDLNSRVFVTNDGNITVQSDGKHIIISQ